MSIAEALLFGSMYNAFLAEGISDDAEGILTMLKVYLTMVKVYRYKHTG